MVNPSSDQVTPVTSAAGGMVTGGQRDAPRELAASEINLGLVTNMAAMLGELNKRMDAQQDTNIMIFNAIENLRKGKQVEPQVVIPLSPLFPRPLFGAGTGGNLGDIPMESAVQTDSTTVTTSQVAQHGHTFPFSQPVPTSCYTYATPSSGQTGSFYNAFDNSAAQFYANTFAENQVARELQQIKEMIRNVPGVTLPYHQASPTCYNESRFVPAIANMEIPKRFAVPHMKKYDGSTDPVEHVLLYQELMDIISIPSIIKEACLCRGFGSTLSGPALKWLTGLSLNSISSYSQLVNMFVNQFSCNRAFEKLTSDLYRVVQQPDESLKDYLNRFNKEAVTIPNLNMSTATEAFRLGLKKGSPYYDELVMTPCKRLEDVRTRAIKFIRLEEDKLIVLKSAR